MSRMHDTRLDSWKAVAEFLHIDIRTARRWEKERALPIHRVPGGGRRAVHAYVSEIEEWLQSGNDSQMDLGDSLLEQDRVADAARRPSSVANGEVRFNGRAGGGGSWWALKKGVSTSVAIGLFGLMLLTFFAARASSTRIRMVFAQLLTGFAIRASPITKIDSVSPIYAEAIQTIVIRGRGFGSRPQTIRMDSVSGGVNTFAGSNQTSLVVANMGEGPHRWAAGRASEVNSCEISVRLEEWTDAQIVISGFSGPIGSGCGEKYQVGAGDRLEIDVFGPLNQCGPGGVPNCPEEVQNGHIGSFQSQVLPSATRDHRCR